jgi:hypothetical protein
MLARCPPQVEERISADAQYVRGRRVTSAETLEHQKCRGLGAVVLMLSR